MTDSKEKCHLVVIQMSDFILEPSEVYDGLDEDGVITNVRVFRFQFGEWTEERAATGNVHVADRPLEG